MMLNFSRRYTPEPFFVETEEEGLTITQGTNPVNRISIKIEDVDDLMRKIQQVKKELIATKIREGNKELFS